MTPLPATFSRAEFSHPPDGWYHVEPLGEHPNRAAGITQVVDAEAVRSIVSHFNSAAAAGRLPHGREMLVDHEHFSAREDKESRAYGWLTALQGRPDGIYGQLRWTTTGREAVDGGDYRFFSTEYDLAEAAQLGGGRVRPLRLAGLTLTNAPNNRGQRAITNRVPGVTGPVVGPVVGPVTGPVVVAVKPAFAPPPEDGERGRAIAELMQLYRVPDTDALRVYTVLFFRSLDGAREHLETLGYRGGSVANADKLVADRLLNRAREISATEHISFDPAWKRAAREFFSSPHPQP